MSIHVNSCHTMAQNQTFEQKKANTSLKNSPDPIHWDERYSFRSQPYRHLDHQNGKIGTFQVRLVEAKNLKRSHWSVLGMGVVKHLGLSNAHGEVSSFATMKLGFRFRDENNDGSMGGAGAVASTSANASALYNHNDLNSDYRHSTEWQNGNLATASASLSSNATSSPIKRQNHPNRIIYTTKKLYQSSTIQFDSNPKWPSVQTETNTSLFDIPLNKGSLPQDGMEIILSIQMKEEKTAADAIVPIGKGGSGDGLLGEGEINVTGLVLRGLESYANENGIDVYDEWITLTNPNDKNNHKDEKQNDKNTHDYGQVRLLTSYEPNGMKPQKGDIIAFESFARQPHVLSKCPTIVPPLHPLRIKDMRGEFILATFDMISSNQSFKPVPYNLDIRDDNDGNDYNFNIKQSKPGKEGSVRIHRNAIFVIERTNIIDRTVDLTLKPTDIILSTQMGQDISDAAQPYVEAAGELLAPVLLSSRLLLEAGKVGGGALAIGVKSAIVNVVENSDPERRRKAKRASFHSD